MVFTKYQVIQLDATVIVGILILLSVTTAIEFSGTQEKSDEVRGLPDFFYDPIYLVTFVTGLFAVSAIIEILILFIFSVKNYNKVKDGSFLQQMPENAPEIASPISLFIMGAGFLWLTATIVMYAISKFVDTQ